MANLIDTRSILIGAGIFVVGSMLLGGVSMLAGEDESSRRIVSGALQIFGVLLPVVAGFASAYTASTRPILQGTIGGAIGALPFMGLGAAFVDGFPLWAWLLTLLFFALLASFGAIVGSHIRAKRPN